MSGCTATQRPVASREHAGATKLVHVVSHGWHVGIALARADVSTAIWPESAEFAGFRHLEVGWGDGDYYPAERGTLRLALRAAFRSTSTVLHVVAFDEGVAALFGGSEIIEIPLSPAGFDALCRFIHVSYARDAAGGTIAIAPALYGHGRFYRATGRYRLLDNSNHWTARALAAAGCPIDPAGAITAGSVMRRARDFGRVIRTGAGQPASDDVGPAGCR